MLAITLIGAPYIALSVQGANFSHSPHLPLLFMILLSALFCKFVIDFLPLFLSILRSFFLCFPLSLDIEGAKPPEVKVPRPQHGAAHSRQKRSPRMLPWEHLTPGLALQGQPQLHTMKDGRSSGWGNHPLGRCSVPQHQMGISGCCCSGFQSMTDRKSYSVAHQHARKVATLTHDSRAPQQRFWKGWSSLYHCLSKRLLTWCHDACFSGT